MTRKYKKRRRRRRTRPLVSQSARQVVVINPPAQRRKKKSGRRKRRTAQTTDPFLAAQFIPERRHYFTGNQRFANNIQSRYDQLLIENKIRGQYANLEKKLESFGELNRTVADNQRNIRSLMGDTEATPLRRRGLSLAEAFDTEGRGMSRTRQTARSRSISPARLRRPTREQPTTLERATARLPDLGLSALAGAGATAAALAAGYFRQPVGTQ